MLEKEKNKFRKTVYDYYKTQGRHDLPWRKTHNPYHVTVSELMLQQTQVTRVIPKYKEFLKAFPSIRVLARAPLSSVLKHWSGLGYNRRAKFLHALANIVIKKHKGKFPQTIEGLQSLPGIGPYTAQAIAAFAYNMPGTCIETNIRTVYIHHFFNDKEGITDKELLPLVEETLDIKNPRAWYAALMDYGSFLKQSGNTVHRKSAHYTKQAPFQNSRRQLRGMVMKLLLEKSVSVSHLRALHEDHALVAAVLDDLVREGFIARKAKKYIII